jgi:KipI family sensor histidine kinase inhibitor
MFKYLPLGDSAFIVKVGNDISVDTHKLVRAFVYEVEKMAVEGVIELIPAYNEVTVCYNPLEIDYRILLDKLKQAEKNISTIVLPPAIVLNIPVCYELEFAPDIDFVASSNNLTRDEVIGIHTSTSYLVFMLGFTPGFCYLGGMNNRLNTPRKEIPRQKIEAGSVGIAGNQTGIYPIDSPGGWQLIGKTPLKLFDPIRKPEFLIQAGNYIKFFSVTSKEFFEIEKQVLEGLFVVRKEAHSG